MAGYKRKGRRRGTKRSKKWSPSRRKSAKRRVRKAISKRKSRIVKKKAEVTQVIKDVVKVEAIKRPFITPKAPAIISQQVSKGKRIPFIIGGLLIALYMLFKKGRKGGKK